MIRVALWVLFVGVWVGQVRLAMAAQLILSPETIPLIQYAYTLVIALLGGAASTLQRYASGAPTERWRLEVARDIFCSALAGLIVFFACQHFELKPMLAAVLIGLAGWGGAKTLEWAWERATKRAAAALGEPERP